MNLTFLGTGAAYYPVLGSTSAYFIKGNCLYLIDCGETTFARIFGRAVLRECERVFVLITHLHADHIGSLGSLISYCKNVIRKEVTVISPDPALVRVLEMTGLNSGDYRHCAAFDRPFPGAVWITPLSVQHDRSMKCYGYLLRDAEETVYYGGDACGMPEGILDRLREGEIVRAYQEVTYETQESASHTSLRQLCESVPRPLRDRIVCMHFGDAYISRVSECGFGVAVAQA